MKSILVLFCHPNLEKSRVGLAWLEAIMGLPGVSVRDLYQLYPEFDIDVRAEQAALSEHDIVVFQHPLYWYSTPALLKQWLDLVLEYGWAYGKEGTALRNKKLMSAISLGGRRDAYEHEGFHGITVEELLLPFRQTARLCQMDYLPPFLAHGAFLMSQEDVLESARQYGARLVALRDEALFPAFEPKVSPFPESNAERSR